MADLRPSLAPSAKLFRRANPALRPAREAVARQLPSDSGGAVMRQTERRRASPQRYDSLQGFYTADSRRVGSREHDVGLWWRESADGPLHRAAWVRDTGELYLVRLGPPEQGGGRVEVLGCVAEHEQLEQALAGWRGHCGEPQSLGWLRGRATRLRGSVRAKRAELAGAIAGSGAMLAAGLSLASELA